MAETRAHPPPRMDQQRAESTPSNTYPPFPISPATEPRRSSYTGPTATTEITYLYLTFSTALPQANTILLASQITHHSGLAASPSPPPPPPPPPPDLTRFANPQQWPSRLKNLHLGLACTATFLTAYASGAYSPPQGLLRQSLGGQPVAAEAVAGGMTTFCVGFALAPMVLAPLSEMNGRYPVFVAAGAVWVAAQAACALVPRLEPLLAARFLAGAGSSVFSTMVGGVIADMWAARARNTPMALFSASALVGLGAGPLVGAVMAHRLGGGGGGGGDGGDDGGGDRWKWIFWHQVVVGGLLMVALALFFRESRGSVVLSRKAARLNQWYEKLEGMGFYGVWYEEEDGGGEGTPSCVCLAEGHEEKATVQHLHRQVVTGDTLRRIRWLVKEDEERSSLGKMVTISVTRPFHLLFTEPVVFFFSLWVSFAWSILYLALGAIPFVFEKVYGWSLEESGYAFAPIIIGTVIQTALSIWQERILQHPRWATSPLDSTTPSADISDESASESSGPCHVTLSGADTAWRYLRRRFPAEAPESRLYFTCLTGTLLPIGLFVFGFTALPRIHWTAPALGLVLATMGIMSIYLAVFNYFADTYHKYASSALAAQSFCRNALGGAFPLVTVAMYKNLGEAKAGALLGGIATALTIVPWVLMFFGERIRARSRFASQLETD
ncbi:Putative drug/proton antiporter YHK8 [Madurella fahalii]|uniref:Drug/proton antiporter YHK8 n=1 Tax=Madurella fahalii TaxID=1157608 RepID=A0ABQ0GJ26_9PEZI